MSYIGNQPTTTAFVTDQFSGTGSQTVFTMTVAPANTSSVLVVVTGVVQDPSTYSVSGTTLTFSAAPPSGTGNISVRYLGIPASGVTTTAYRTVTNFTATAGQTTFSVPSYTVGYIDVYRNGVRLAAADYTATNGTTVVLASAASAGDSVVTESFYVSSVLNAIPATAGAVNSTYIASGAVGTTQIASSPTITSPTLSNPTFTGTASGTVLVSGTAQASTSGTSIDFTGIPSWVKRITVMFNGMSTSGSSDPIIRLGTGGVAETTGYVGVANTTGNTTGGNSSSVGFLLTGSPGASETYYGSVIFTNISGNSWVGQGTLGRGDAAYVNSIGGSKTLAGVLNMVRITTVNGTDTFDAGSINILYE